MDSALADAFVKFGLSGNAGLISRYFAAFEHFELYPDVEETIAIIARHRRIAVVSNIDDDLLARTPLSCGSDLVCTAERARGYKPDGALFRYLLREADVDLDRIAHAGQSQYTDMVGGKPLGLWIAWINRRGVALDPTIPRPDITLSSIAELLPLLTPRD